MKILRQFVWVIFLNLAAIHLVNAAESKISLDQFRKFALRQMEQDKVPGMVIGYVCWDGEEQMWAEGFGYSDLENHVATKPETAFRLGSVSKPLTAAAVLKLAEQGKIDLDAEIQKYVPYFPKKKWRVTVRQLLGHLGGISHYKNYSAEGHIKEHKTTREAIRIFEEFDLVAEPGTKFSYSSYGYNLLAAAVEGASGMSFGEFIKKNIWQPLGMENTRLDDPADLIPNRSRGYRMVEGEIKNSEFVDVSSRLGAGGTRSTVPDLLKFARGLVEGKVLTAKTLPLMYSSMKTKDGHFTDYGSGWDTAPENGHFMLRHTGSQQETSAVLMCFPAMKLAIACAINQEDAGASVFANRLYEVLMKERWNLTAYVKENRDLYEAMNSVFAYGLSYFEEFGKPETSDSKQISSAFQYFVSSAEKRNADQIKNGIHPVAGEPYIKMGSYMAQILSEQKSYNSSGPIPFFNDYLKQCEKKNAVSGSCNFPKELKRTVSSWNESWTKTNGMSEPPITITVDSNLDEIGALLRSKFRSASAYPDYSREFADLTWDSLIQGNNKKSLQAGEIGTTFYPESARLLAFYGVSLAANSQKTQAITYLKKSYQLDREGPAEPDWVSELAETLAGTGKIAEAIRIMEAGTVVHPKHASLFSDIGEAYFAMNDFKKASEYFHKALEIDPKLERAKEMLGKLKETL